MPVRDDDDVKLVMEGLRHAYGFGVSEAADRAYQTFRDAFFRHAGSRVTKKRTEALLRTGNLALAGTGYAVFKTGESWSVRAPNGGVAYGTFKDLRETFGRSEHQEAPK